MTYLAIVDDKREIRNALKEKFSRLDGYEILFTAEHGVDYLQSMREARKAIEPQVVLMDLDMPVMNGVQAITEGKVRYPNTRYLVLTIFDEDEKIFNAIRAGADGYLLKDEPIEKIKEAIDNLLKDEGAPMSPSIARKVLNLLSNRTMVTENRHKDQLENQYNLTEREKEILMYLVEGLEYKEIAVKLALSPNTVRNMVSKIYNKLHVSSRIQAAKVIRKL